MQFRFRCYRTPYMQTEAMAELTPTTIDAVATEIATIAA